MIVKSRLTLVCLSLIAISLTFAGISYAEIDPKAVVGMWLFDQGTGRTAKDSFNGHDGEIKGDTKWVNGKFGNALEFSGEEDSFVNIPHEDSLSLTTWTIVAWVKLGEPPEGFHTIVYKNLPEQVRNYGMGISATGLRVDLSKGNTRTSAQGKTSILDNQWHHVVGNYDGAFVRAYVDGKMDGEAAFEGPPQTNSGAVNIGRHSASEKATRWPAKGIIDEVGLFNVALTEDEIKNIMTEGLKEVASIESESKLSTTWGNLKVTQ